jgi:hypothetical protein
VDFVGDALPVDLLSNRGGGCRDRRTGLADHPSAPLPTESGRDETTESRRKRLSCVGSVALNDDMEVEGRILEPFMTDILLSGRSVTACNRDAGRLGVDVISSNSAARRRRLSARCRSTGD